MECSEKQQLIEPHPELLGWYVWNSFICGFNLWLENQLFCLSGPVRHLRPVVILLRSWAKARLMTTTCGGGTGSASRRSPHQGLTGMRGIGPGGSCASPVPWASSSWLERWLVSRNKNVRHFSHLQRKKKPVFWLHALFAGGYAARSLAIMTDAAHLLTDFGSIAISLFSLWLSSRPPTGVMTFGWHRAGEENRLESCLKNASVEGRALVGVRSRLPIHHHQPKFRFLRCWLLCPAEILGMLLSVVSIWAVTAALVLSAVQRLSDGDYDIDGQIMLITSGCAVGVNILWVWWARGGNLSEWSFLKEFGRRPVQDGADPPSVWRFSWHQSQTQPAARPL